jgi:myosin-7
MSTPETNPNHPWIKKKDPKSGRTYYRNTVAKKSSWVKPDGWVDQEEKESAKKETKAAAATDASGAAASDDSVDPNDNPKFWQEKKAKDGRVYYVNKKSQKRQWKKPVCLGGPTPKKTLKGAAKAVAAAGGATGDKKKTKAPLNTANPQAPENWRQAEHKGKTYWYNRVTKERTWKNPLAKKEEKKKEKEEESESESDDEDLEKDFTPQMKREMERRREVTRNMLYHHAEAEPEGTVEEYKYQFAKHRHGFWNRLMRTGGVADADTLLTFKRTLIKKALLKQNRHLDAEAVQAFKNVMSFMGDRVSGKDEIEHARKILRNLMQAPSGLRDEIYLQLIKQTTQNPRVSSTRKGWQLMNFCLVTFPPSKSLKKFLSNKISMNKEQKSEDPEYREVEDIVRRCEATLPKITLMGQRKQVPSRRELVAVMEGKKVTLTIHLLEAEVSKTVNVDSFTLVRDVEDLMAEKCNLLTTSPFAMYEAVTGKENVESILNRRDRILDVLGAWENAPVEEVDHSNEKSFKKQKVKRKDAKREKYDRLLYKAKLVLKTQCKEIIRDTEALNLLFQQASHDIITARYPPGRWGAVDTETEIIRVAALQMQANQGDYNSAVHDDAWIFSELSNYLPGGKVYKKREATETKDIIQKIKDQFAEFAGLSTLEAKVMYLDTVQEWVYYGITFFSVGQRNYPESWPNPTFLGINCDGVMVVHPTKKTKLANWEYNQVVHWGHASEKFVIVLGNAVQQLKLILKTKRGDQMSNLIHSYIKYQLKQAESEL